MTSTQDPVMITISSYQISAYEYIGNTNQLSYFPGLQYWLDNFIGLLPGKKVLDVGFGSGRDLVYFIDHGLDVEGIELTPKFIDLLKERVHIPLHLMDMRNLIFPDNFFHGLWCCSSFLHLPHNDALPTLQGFARVLKQDGILYLSLKEGFGNEWRLDKNSNISTAHRYFTYYSNEQIHGLLLESGFELLAESKNIGKRVDRPHWLNLMYRLSTRD